jgi:RNA polymerase sigma factor (sigma-70 family)
MTMATPPAGSGGPGPGPPSGRDPDGWKRIWSHREQLLTVARRRSMSQEDAEDAVHEAMLRAAERPRLDDERLGAWLTTVTMRLCVDRYRQVNREAEVRRSPRLAAPGPVPVEEAVCDRAEARWVAVRSAALPARQAEALWLKAEDLDVDQVAGKMGLSYRTVESLLARARRTLRNSLTATLGLALLVVGRGPRTGGYGHAVATASVAATLTVVGCVLLPYVPHPEGSGARPERPGASRNPAGTAPVPGGGPPGAPVGGDRVSAATGSASAAGSPPAARGRGLPTGVSLPPLPSVSVSAGAPLSVSVEVSVPALPSVPGGLLDVRRSPHVRLPAPAGTPIPGLSP